MLYSVWNTFKRLKPLLVIVGIIFVLSVATGIVTKYFRSLTFLSYSERRGGLKTELVPARGL